MRKLLMALILGAALTLGLGVTAPAASAASCSYSTNPTYKDNYSPTGIYFTALIYNCNGVEAVRWRLQPYATARTGWFDWACMCWAQTGVFTQAPGAYPFPGPDVTLVNPCTGVCGVWVSSPLWFYGQCRNLTGRWYSQIKSTATHLWSSVHTVDNVVTTICN